MVPDLSSGATRTLGDRLLALWEETGDPALGHLANGAPQRVPPALGCTPAERPLTESEIADWTSTVLMNSYKTTGNTRVFALLFELNARGFMQAIQAQLRRTGGTYLDPNDVLQEVFLNIYRYPFRFLAEKADSFRNWGHRIVRNTLLKLLKTQGRVARMASLDDEPTEREDTAARTPLRAAVDGESARLVDRAFLIYLHLYLLHFNRLSDRERQALTMVELDGASYKEAAAALGIRLENLKMVIFRGRRKILRGVLRSLDDLDSCPAASL